MSPEIMQPPTRIPVERHATKVRRPLREASFHRIPVRTKLISNSPGLAQGLSDHELCVATTVSTRVSNLDILKTHSLISLQSIYIYIYIV